MNVQTLVVSAEEHPKLLYVKIRLAHILVSAKMVSDPKQMMELIVLTSMNAKRVELAKVT